MRLEKILKPVEALPEVDPQRLKRPMVELEGLRPLEESRRERPR